jgi:hypothetical protein
MSRGRRSKVLPADVIECLEKFRLARRYSFPQLNRDVMATPFKWTTLKNALDGKPVWEFNYHWIVDWVERNLRRVAPAIRDFKAKAANDDSEREEETAAPARLRSE